MARENIILETKRLFYKEYPDNVNGLIHVSAVCRIDIEIFVV